MKCCNLFEVKKYVINANLLCDHVNALAVGQVKRNGSKKR